MPMVRCQLWHTQAEPPPWVMLLLRFVLRVPPIPCCYQAEQIESMSSWNQLADVRGNVYAARMQYDGFLKEANASWADPPRLSGPPRHPEPQP